MTSPFDFPTRVDAAAVRARALAHLRDRGVRLPTFAELAEPASAPRAIRERLAKIDPDTPHSANLYRVHWFNDLQRTGQAATPLFVELPEAFTGVQARIVVALGALFPMIRAHKVLAAYACLAPRLVSGRFDPTQPARGVALHRQLLPRRRGDLQDPYVIVNEAGASVYSTSPIGREELPKYDATVRGAVSIGRRLLDPLSELVKINPANIGVGLYQHDLKAKHLRESLDAVVESCVNYVGVDVNTASPALLRYVSGLNQLTARRLYEYRLQHGPFQSREQFKQVPGFGDATFVQSAGFLKIYGGASPLDATWIHPESYEVARRLLERLESSEADLAIEVTPAPTAVAAQPSPASSATFGGDVIERTGRRRPLRGYRTCGCQ